jgi:hypothetical protein
MVIDNTINKTIDDNLSKADIAKREVHKSSGKLSASMLSWPLQWQILKHLGVEQKPIDSYTLRKFYRGTSVEDWLVTQIPGIVEKQKFVQYRDVVGYIDAYVDSSGYEFKQGKMVHEIKSVSNAKYKNIITGKHPDEGHCLQACLYAMAIKSNYFAIDYVATDDLRVTTFIEQVKDWKDEVDAIINQYERQLVKKEIPVFEPRYAWQKNVMYNNYPEWAGLTKEEIEEKVKRLQIVI